MKLSGRYAPGLYAGVGGILAIVVINAFTIPDSLQQRKERDHLAAQAEIEQARAEAARKTAEAYAQNGIASPNPELLIADYTLSDTPPSLDWQNTVDPTQKTFVFDKNRLCIGYAHGGQFYFVKHTEGVCNHGTR